MGLRRKDAFSRGLVAANRLEDADFSFFVFFPGMLFGEVEKWWDGAGQRPTPHEGIDICCFRTRSGDIKMIGSSALIVCPFSRARVIAFMDDFIGKTIVLRPVDDEWEDFYFFFAHLLPEKGIRIGDGISEGKSFARIAPGSGLKGAPAHVHVSVARKKDLPDDSRISWPLLTGPFRHALLDPMEFFNFPGAGLS